MIQSSGGLTKDQIEKMVQDAERYAEEDKVLCALHSCHRAVSV